MKKERISAIIISKNEESNIEECLKSLIWVDEIVIIDSGSTDKTEFISKKYTNNFYKSKWQGFGIQKQKALDKASGEWILSIDADERVTNDLQKEIIKTISSKKNINGYKIPRKSFYLNKFIKHSGWYPDYVMRLARRDSCYFSSDIVHERLIIKDDNPPGVLKSELRHYPYQSISHHLTKINHYSNLSAEKMFNEGRKISWIAVFLVPIFGFFRSYIFRLGILDGWNGLVIACSTALIGWLKYLKLKELYIKKRVNSS